MEQVSAQDPIKRERPMNFYVGTSGYSYKEWKGTFYPPKLPAKKMLSFYTALSEKILVRAAS
jgi:hypothetical protein